MGLGTEFPLAFGKSALMRIDASEFRSQECHDQTFLLRSSGGSYYIVASASSVARELRKHRSGYAMQWGR